MFLRNSKPNLRPASASPYSGARGKAEWKVYENGTRQCKVSLSNLNLADGTMLELLVDGHSIARLIAQQDIARYR